MKIKADFHVHSVHSPDSAISFRMLVKACKEKEIDVVAIMDHDKINGAFSFQDQSEELKARGEWAPRILVGEEIRTSGGEICGLFLKNWIPKRLSPFKTMELIKEQGGLVYIPHPFDLLKLKRLHSKDLLELERLIDIIEVFNGKPRIPMANKWASDFIEEHPIALKAAGSDSHEPTHLGAAHVVLEDFSGPEDLLEKLKSGTIVGKRYNPFAAAYPRTKSWKEFKRDLAGD